MFTIIGYAVVFGAVIGGFVLEGGPVAVLNQTVEFLIIGGRTFLGILLCYGVAQPLVQKMELLLVEESKYLECIKTGILAYLHGAAPIIAVEYARRVVFSTELEEVCRGKKE